MWYRCLKSERAGQTCTCVPAVLACQLPSELQFNRHVSHVSVILICRAGAGCSLQLPECCSPRGGGDGSGACAVAPAIAIHVCAAAEPGSPLSRQYKTDVCCALASFGLSARH